MTNPNRTAAPGDELLAGWKINHAQKAEDDNTGEGVWELGYLDAEDDRFSPIITVDTGLYFQPEQAEPLARAILARLALQPAQGVQAAGEAVAQWQPIETAPKDRRLLAKVEGQVRMIHWGKTSHVPLYGFCLADQGPEDFDLCKPDGWMELPGIGAEKTGDPQFMKSADPYGY